MLRKLKTAAQRGQQDSIEVYEKHRSESAKSDTNDKTFFSSNSTPVSSASATNSNRFADYQFCTVNQLDPRLKSLKIGVTQRMLGDELFNHVCNSLEMKIERHYFGLSYTHAKYNKSYWLRLDQLVHKQLKQASGNVLQLEVKYYPQDPENFMRDKLTRYLLYLQLRRDLQLGHLHPIETNKLLWLCTYALQEELASRDKHARIPENLAGYMEELKMLPPLSLSNLSQENIETIQQHLLDVGEISAEEAETEFIRLSVKENTYGIKLVSFQDNQGQTQYMALEPRGIKIYQDQHHLKHDILWEKISKMEVDKKSFLCHTSIDARKNTLEFKLETIFAAEAFAAWAQDTKHFFNPVDSKPQTLVSIKSGIFGKRKLKIIGRSQIELMRSASSVDQSNPVSRAASMQQSRSEMDRNKYSTFNGRLGERSNSPTRGPIEDFFNTSSSQPNSPRSNSIKTGSSSQALPSGSSLTASCYTGSGSSISSVTPVHSMEALHLNEQNQAADKVKSQHSSGENTPEETESTAIEEEVIVPKVYAPNGLAAGTLPPPPPLGVDSVCVKQTITVEEVTETFDIIEPKAIDQHTPSGDSKTPPPLILPQEKEGMPLKETATATSFSMDVVREKDVETNLDVINETTEEYQLEKDCVPEEIEAPRPAEDGNPIIPSIIVSDGEAEAFAKLEILEEIIANEIGQNGEESSFPVIGKQQPNDTTSITTTTTATTTTALPNVFIIILPIFILLFSAFIMTGWTSLDNVLEGFTYISDQVLGNNNNNNNE